MLRCILLCFVCFLTAYCQLLDKDEGEKCSWRGVSGTCVNVFKCQSFISYRKNRDYPPSCSYNRRDPIICCTDCDTVEDIRKIIFNEQAGMLQLTGPKAKDECIHYIDKLDYDCKINTTVRYSQILDIQRQCIITVESKTSPKYTPQRRESYMALLGYGNEMETAEWSCAGAIISNKFILTAGHCIVDNNRRLVKYIAVGINKRTDPPSTWQKHNIVRWIPYPEYRLTSKYHDIALLEIANTITFNSKVLPACLHTDQILENEAEIITWEQSKDQGTLQPVTLTQFDSLQCSIFYPQQDRLKTGYNGTTQICYGNLETPTDSCQSDSGGPLLAKSRVANCAPMILGVISIDRKCGTEASSGLFTRISYYVPWIQSIVWP